MTTSRLRRTVGAALLAAAVVAGASACTDTLRVKGEQPSRITGEAPSRVKVHTVTLGDGTQVLCIWEGDVNAGGLSCDWAGKTRPEPTS